MSPSSEQTHTFRGRSLDEIVPRIREELGDDAVIVARRETTSGGVGGFFARREIEVDVRAGESAPAAAQAFAAQLAEASERHQAPESRFQTGPNVPRPATSHEIDALPSAADVSVDDLFPAPPPQAQGLAALFNAGIEPAVRAAPEPEPEPTPQPEPWPEPAAFTPPPSPEPEPEPQPAAFTPPPSEPSPAHATEPSPEPRLWEREPARFAPEPPTPEPPTPERTGPDPSPAPERDDVAVPPSAFGIEQPTGQFDYISAVPPRPEPQVEAPAPDEPSAFDDPAPVAPSQPAIPSAARAAADRLIARGLRAELAEAVAEEAITSLLPLTPGADPKVLVVDALARRIPIHALRRGRGVVGFAGPGGAGKTRCVARLAAAHARHGALPVTVVALRSPDGGAELTRLLAPYGVPLHAVESGAEGAAKIAALRGEGLVILDTPGVSPRAEGELRALGSELRAIAPDELHLTVPATIGPDPARELVTGVRELGVSALALTHTDETEMLGTVVGLAIESGLPLSYLARGQAVEAGLRPASATELAAALAP